MKKLVSAAMVVSSAASIANIAHAEDGIYYGASVGLSVLESTSEFGSTFVNTPTVGGVIGYRKDLAGGRFWSAEADVSLPVQSEMSYDWGPDACVNASPDWCRVDGLSHVRGIYGMPVGGGYDVIGSAGLVVAAGQVEDGSDIYVDTYGYGYSIGIGLQTAFSTGATGRVELIYDDVDFVDQEDYPKDLTNLAIKASYLF
ncbi:hypothetical protein SAMN04488005_2416 [Yoonia tamlensis]|uniref:Outer membrane protein beta-barrel domain-containing protein n=1 Tax=Yoonia tamlensis TaxID=390270 RepID=A0A1I6HAC1_9RHOB|nr:hypothetical protein [Yoonia tamlensis]SFR51227.1 hypothetical protein SAMN04488005_2416 [Yoonia tamlensis]